MAAAYVRSAIAKADAAGAALLVITLRTPGGLVDSTRDINNAIIDAKTPVAVFVAPAGSRAASAGFLITIAADVAAMAPGTHIGAAHPVSGDGEKVDDTMAKKMASDVAGYARTLAQQRKRNVALVEQAVTESRSFTEQEALAASPPLIDLVATDVPDLLRKLDGRTIARFDGRRTVLRTAGAVERTVEMTWTQQILSAIAHPQIAYLLLTLGTLGLTIEMWSPGAIFPGVVGGICLLLAFFAFQVLPVNYAGVLLILFGLVLLILEVKVTSFGLLAVGGVLSLFFGSMMLIDSPLPELQIGLRLILPVTLVCLRDPVVPRAPGGQSAADSAGHGAGRHDRRSRDGADGDRPGRRRPGQDPRRDLVRDGVRADKRRGAPARRRGAGPAAGGGAGPVRVPPR